MTYLQSYAVALVICFYMLLFPGGRGALKNKGFIKIILYENSALLIWSAITGVQIWAISNVVRIAFFGMR